MADTEIVRCLLCSGPAHTPHTPCHQPAETVRLDVVKIAGHVRISRELAEDLRLMREAMSRPISREAWEAWLADPDPDWGDL